MSGRGPEELRLDPGGADRRVARTRHRVIDAFAEAARARPYDEIRVGDVIADAHVGRSTFYAHYRGKDDVLRQALGTFYALLADELAHAVLPERVPAPRAGLGLVPLLAHFRENRLLARRLTTGPAAEAYARSLDTFAAAIAARLEPACAAQGLAPRVPLALLAAGLAHAAMATILRWVQARPEVECAVEELAASLRALARGAVRPQLSARP